MATEGRVLPPLKTARDFIMEMPLPECETDKSIEKVQELIAQTERALNKKWVIFRFRFRILHSLIVYGRDRVWMGWEWVHFKVGIVDFIKICIKLGL